MVTQNYIVNLKVGGGISPIVKLSQGDVGRELVFLLYDGAVRFTPPSGATVKIKGTKPSGLGFSETCTLSGSVARVFTTLAMTQEGGNIPAELEITSGNNVIGTANFVIYSEPSPHPAGTTDGTTEEARTVLAQCEKYAQIAQEAAEAASGDYTEVRSDVDDLKADLEDLDERVDALEAGGGGSGLTDAVKTALMNIVNHVAWDDDDPTGQTYITALQNALYPPAPPASLTSIAAVYTQSGTVYDTDTLNDLKSDLVVTAHYSDNTSHAVTDYTLSGTLAAGTSVIAVNYNGKSTTFTVTVTAGALYPLENGSHTFTENDRVLTVTNGSHIVYEWPNATTAAVNGAYLNLSTVSDNDTSATTASNINLNDVFFTIPANAQVVFAIKNIQLSNVGTAGSSNKYAFNMRNGSTNLNFSDGDKGINDTADIIFTKTVSEDTPVTCVYLYISRQFSRMEADISLTVNNVRWI